MGFRIEAPKQDGNARFNSLKVNLNENNSATRAVVVDNDGNFYYGTGGGSGTGGVAGTSGTSGANGTSGTGFNTISNPALGRVLLSDGSTNSAIAATNLNFSNNTLQVTGSLIADSLLINSDVFEFTGSLRVLGGITGSLLGTASWAYNALTASSADAFTIRSDKFEFTGSLEVLGGITGSLFGTSSWAVSASWSPGSGQSDTASYVSSSNVFGPYGFDSIQTASFAFTASSADTFVIRSDVFEFTGSVRVQGGITGSLLGTSSFAVTASHALNVQGTASWAYNALTASSADTFTIRSDKFEFTGSVQVLGGVTGSLFGTSSWAVSASWAPGSGQSATASYVSSSNVFGPRGFDSIRTASLALTASSADTFTIRSDVFEFTGSVRVQGGITGSLLGTASFSTTASHALNVPATASYALVASSSIVTNTTTGTGPFYLTFVDETSGSRALRVDSSTLTFNATTNILTVTASSAITASNSITSSNSLVASSSVITDTTTGTGPFYLTFVDGTTGNRPLRVDSSTLTFNATTNVLSATASNAITASTAATASSADAFTIRSDKFEFTGSVQVLGGVTGSLLGTSSFAVTASHALNVPATASYALVASSSVITDTTTGTGPFYLTFVDGTLGNKPLRVDSNTLTFNATTNVLNATASLAQTASSADTFTIRSDKFEFTGSLEVLGGITGSLLGTSSFAVTASYALNALNAANAFIQNGNSFGTTAVLGTNDNQNLELETNGSTRITLDTSGNTNIATGYQFSSIGTLNWGTSGYNIGQLSWNNGTPTADKYAAVYSQGIYNLRLGTTTYPTALFVTSSNGYVGVNNSAPQYNLDVTGTAYVSSYSIVGDWLQVYGMLYHRSNIAVLNKAQDGWVTWATRDTTEADSRIDLSNIRTITTSGTVDQVITLNATDSGWQYIGWQWAGTRQFYTGLDNSGRFAFGSDLGGSFYFNGGSVGIGNTNPLSTLHLNGSFRQVNGNVAEYKNVVSFAYDDNQTGGYVVKTPFQINNQFEMPIIHVKGYGYGGSKLYDFKIVVYTFSSGLLQYSIVDNGNDADIKYLAQDASGFLCIAFGDLAATNYFYRFTVDCIATRYPSNNYQTGWTFTQTTSANYGMSQLYLTTPAITQTVSGKVGVGVITPQNKLDVLVPQGIAASFGGPLDPGEFSGMHFGYLETGNADYRKSALVFERTDNYGQGNNAGGKIHFLLNNNSGTSATALTDSVVTIDSDASGTVGSVRMGVGTTSPSAALHVSRSIALVTDGAAQDSAGYYPLGVTRDASPNNLAYIGMTRAGNMPFGLGINSSNALIMGATTSGTQVITPALSLSQGGTLIVGGDVTAYGSPSDISLKNIKEKIPNALDSVLKLNGYKFDWKEPNEISNIKEDIGVIAQEVEELFPELVRRNQDTGMKSVRYQGLIGVLIEAIKEQQNQIEELKYLLKNK